MGHGCIDLAYVYCSGYVSEDKEVLALRLAWVMFACSYLHLSGFSFKKIMYVMHE